MSKKRSSSIDLSKVKRVHFVGIKGVAMSALAIIAKERDMIVTGSDIGEEFPTDTLLKNKGIIFQNGFKTDHIGKHVDLVVYTGAHGGISNIEVEYAHRNNIPIISHGKALGLFMHGSKEISVAGSHGKTTTAAMIATILMHAGFDPSFAVGCGNIFPLGSPGHFGSGDYFISEADEYATDPTIDSTPRFLWQHPYVSVITNIDFDHPDVFDSIADIKDVFLRFAQKTSKNGFVVCGIDNKNVREILPFINATIITFGKDTSADFHYIDARIHNKKTQFTPVHKGKKLGTIKLAVCGEHNILNSLAAIAVLFPLGISFSKIQKGLSQFIGTKRRFEFIEKRKGVYYYDDYAHHPAEIVATLACARSWFPGKKITVIFQPHTYSRTQKLLSLFAKSFSNADCVLITKIYASAREKPIPNISGELLAQKAAQYHSNVHFVSEVHDVIQYLGRSSGKNDVIITMGAGDVYKIHSSLKTAI